MTDQTDEHAAIVMQQQVGQLNESDRQLRRALNDPNRQPIDPDTAWKLLLLDQMTAPPHFTCTPIAGSIDCTSW